MIKLFNLGTNYHSIKASYKDGYVELFYSYETLVAIRFINPELEQYRIQPSPSATTTRHLKKMGVYDWPLASKGFLEAQAAAAEITFNF